MNSPMNSQEAMLDLLETWVSRKWLREMDVALVRFFASEVSGLDPALMLATALVSHQLGRGHVCLDLVATLNDPFMALSLPPEESETPEHEETLQPKDLLDQMSPQAWISRLTQVELVGTGEGRTPLVLVGHRLYLRRYWRYERQVEAAINARIANSQQIAEQLPELEFKTALGSLFPPSDRKTDWQKVACALAARSAFSIVTGGPGTGKTTTVVRLLALLQSIALATGQQRPLQIRLAAPTGKAAARLKESITRAIDNLPGFVQENSALKASIPSDVTTLHRLLGPKPNSRFFRHDARNPLPLDVLVIDEGSMVDLEMMAAMLLALPPSARLILLGDKDQLASVEAGSVLGELCRRAEAGHFTPETIQWIEAMTGDAIDGSLADSSGSPLDQQIVMLRESRRFVASSGIGQLASAVNADNPKQIQQIWEKDYPDLRRLDCRSLDEAEFASILLGQGDAEDVPQGRAGYLRLVAAEQPSIDAGKPAFDTWAERVLKAFGRFQLLCALRNGPFGVTGLNQRIETFLAKQGLIDPANQWYAGRPVLITRNDYQSGLMNGDIGITLPFPFFNKAKQQLEWSLRVAFPSVNGQTIYWALPSRLLSAETVYALTVHKSQGSEFEHCVLLLPPQRNPVLTRELVYTGITRGKKWFTLVGVGNRQILEEAVSRTVQRSGGLFSAESHSIRH